MNITEIKFVEDKSQPIFHVICDTGYETNMIINTWYLTPGRIVPCILDTLDDYFTNRLFIDNLDEIVYNVVEQLVENKCVPYTIEEIL